MKAFPVNLHPVSSDTSQLRDITVSVETKTSLITLTLTDDVSQLVLQKVGNTTAQVRMRSVKATDASLKSALLKTGVQSISAHIERKDVLVLNVRYTQTISSMKILSREDGKIVVQVQFGENGESTADSNKPAEKKSAKDSVKIVIDPKYKKLTPTIIIDAGHGGYDPGAIGVGKVREKNVTLAVAKLLKKELKLQMPKARIIMTRSNDKFISLGERRAIAQKYSRATMFVSLHCNSMPEKPNPANGCECYVMRTPGNEDIAEGSANEEKEPKVLLGMAMFGAAPPMGTKYADKSRKLASLICSSLSDEGDINNRGIRRAGFYVLTETPMPSVLVELGYVTHVNESKVLVSTSGQAKLAHGIFLGIGRYLLAKKR